MVKRLAKLLAGKREKGEIGYYRKLAYIENKLREFVIGVIIALIVTVIITLMTINSVSTNGKYVPDGYDIHGNLIDTDGDGDYHHWVEEE